MADELTLHVAGGDIAGWQQITIDRSMEQMTGAFSVTMTDGEPAWARSGPVSPGDPVTISIDREVVLTGYVDRVEPSHDGGRHDISVTGRDKAADLVDCSADLGEWRGLGAVDIIRAIVKPFGLRVVDTVGIYGPVAEFRIQPGEAAMEAIDRLCRQAQVLPVAGPDGTLKLIRAGLEGTGTVLIAGAAGNVLSASGAFTADGRHSVYEVIGQQRAGDDAETSAIVRAQAADGEVARYRPLRILAEDQADQPAAARRAQWERSVRRGRSRRVTCTVQGWRDAEGRLWGINRRVTYRDAWLRVDAELLTAAVRMSLDGGGRKTELELCDPAAFDPEPMEQDKKTKRIETEIGW